MNLTTGQAQSEKVPGEQTEASEECGEKEPIIFPYPRKGYLGKHYVKKLGRGRGGEQST